MTSMSGVRIVILNVCDNVGVFLYLFSFFIFLVADLDLPNVRRWLWLAYLNYYFLTSVYLGGGFRSCLFCLIYRINNSNLINWLLLPILVEATQAVRWS